MENFEYCNPTQIVFGRGSIEKLGTLLGPGKIMLTYGGGSIKANGVYDQVRRALSKRTLVEFGGIGANPCYETLIKAVELGRKEKVNFLLPVGGGSVLDGSKFIAAGIPFKNGDPWRILEEQAEVETALPLGTVLTLPATGSESNGFAVISRESTREKLFFSTPKVHPRFAILDPETTFSLPKKQVRNGIVDAFVHVTEQYLTYPAGGDLQDRQAEAILATLIEKGPITLREPKAYDPRATLVWCATQALNGLIGCGVPGDFATHMIGHELTAFYGLDHAETLAAILPHLLRFRKAAKAQKLIQYGQRVWGLVPGEDLAEEAIVRTERFFQDLGMPTRLDAYGISLEEAAQRVGDRFIKRGTKLGEQDDIGGLEAAAIIRMSKT